MDEFTTIFPRGEENTAFAQYFIGKSYLARLSSEQVGIANVTFEPGCRNNWHVHHASKGGGQILLCIGGRGWYQEWGQPARALKAGDVVNIPVGVKHWHGAAKDCWFATWPWKSPARTRPTSGSNPWMTSSTAVSAERPAHSPARRSGEHILSRK